MNGRVVAAVAGTAAIAVLSAGAYLGVQYVAGGGGTSAVAEVGTPTPTPRPITSPPAPIAQPTESAPPVSLWEGGSGSEPTPVSAEESPVAPEATETVQLVPGSEAGEPVSAGSEGPTVTPTPPPPPPPPPGSAQFGCWTENAAPSAQVPVLYPPPTGLRVTHVDYVPHNGFGSIEVAWDEPSVDVTCRVLEIESPEGRRLSGAGTSEGYPSGGAMWTDRTTGRYCFRAYVGNALGRSEFSEQLCIDVQVPSRDVCDIDPHFGSNTVCELFDSRPTPPPPPG